MKAIILDKPGQLRLFQMEEPPVPGTGEVLVRVRQVGVCGTDLHAFRGEQPFFTYPRILGHELGVEVVAVDPQEHRLTAGVHCAVEPYFINKPPQESPGLIRGEECGGLYGGGLGGDGLFMQERILIERVKSAILLT